MDFLNIGSGELVFLILVAILVVGPKQALELTQQVGRFIARLRREWDAVQRDVITEMRELNREGSAPSQPSILPPEATASDEDETA